MAILTDAELALGMSRHLSAYSGGSDRAALAELEYVGWVFDLAFRLRGSTTSSAGRVGAIGLEIGLSRRDLQAVMATLEALGWVSVQRDKSGTAVAVNEVIPPPAELIAAAPRVMDTVLLGAVERAALAVLRATTLQPLIRDDALAAGLEACGDDEEATDAAIRHLVALGLVRVASIDAYRDVLFNPNVWTQGDQVAKAALKAADAKATKEVSALLEELASNPALPESRVTATEPRWVQFAVSQGLVQRSVIQTTDNKEEGFLFTPHLARDPFGATAGDASGHVRQLVGSMIYATTFAKYRLDSPSTFLRALIRNGVAGHTESIGSDYPMLEKAGIIRVLPGQGTKFRMELLQSDVAEDAVKLLNSREASAPTTADAAALRAQRSYIHVERDRARLALSAQSDAAEERRLIAALREVNIKRTMGNRPW